MNSNDETKQINNLNNCIMKQFTLKSLMLLLLLLIGGGSSAWGETKTGTIKFGTNNLKISSANVTGNDDLSNSWRVVTVGTTSFTQQPNYSQVGSSDKPAKSITFTMTLPSDVKFTTFSAEFGGFSGTKGNISLTVDGIEVGSGNLNAANNVTVGGGLKTAATGKELKVSVTGIAKGVKCYNIKYIYEDSSTPQPGEVALPTLSLEEGTYWKTQTLTIGVPEGAADVLYTLDGTDPKESNTAELITKATNLELSATTTVRAIAVDNNDNYSKEVSRTYTFAPSIANTKETAYTTVQAIEIIKKTSEAQLKDEVVYVKGIVSKIVTPFNTKYGNVSFDVSVDGSTEGEQFRFYRTQKDAENTYTEDPNIEVGATVVGCGTLLLYKDNDNTQKEIYEFAAGNYLVEYKAPVEKVLKSIAISGEATKTTYKEGEAFDPTGLVVTATYDDESTEDVTSRVKWTFNPETLALGTTSVEVMASIGSDAISDVYVVNGITVNEKVVLVGNSIVVAEDKKNSKWVAMTTSNKGTYFEAVDLVKVGDKYITTGKLDDILFYVNTVDGKTSIQNPADNKYVQATGAKKVSYTEKEYLWSNNGEQLAAAQTAHGTLQYNVGSPRFTTYASKIGQYATIVDKSNVYEGAEIALSGTDGTHYFTTFSSDKAVEFVDATVYTVGVNENKLSLNEVKGNQVPANTGVLVQSNETNAMYVYIESAPAIEGNLLRASVTEQTTTGADDTKEYKYYMLSYNKDNENLGFYWGENDGAAFTSKAGRAYLAVEKTNEVAAVKGFSLSDMETGISQVCGSAANNGVIYDLQGRRVERAVRGLYIMNGRKVMVK